MMPRRDGRGDVGHASRFLRASDASMMPRRDGRGDRESYGIQAGDTTLQ